METYTAIKSRRSIRAYKDDPIPEDVLDRIIGAGRLAPSAHNFQPWKIIVIRDQRLKGLLKNAGVVGFGAADRYQESYTASWARKSLFNAPVVLVGCCLERESVIKFHDGETEVVCFKWPGFVRASNGGGLDYRSTAAGDLAIALDHVAIAACAEGLGTCWIGAFSEQTIQKVLSIPADVRVPYLMLMGYPAESPDPRPRRPIDELICYDGYI